MLPDDEQDTTDLDLSFRSPTHQRRLPLPTKLTFEQNITNLIEKESPLLQSELLTAEHELSVLRSRLAVNEGVTAVTGSILESLKEQFQPRLVDTATSPLDIYRTNLLQHSLASQTSPMIEALPDMPESVEIHYDAQLPTSAYLVVKTKNSFWIAQPIATAAAQTHLKSFSSPVMRRATLKLPEAFDQTFLADSDTEDEPVLEQAPQLSPTRQEPLTEANVQRLSTEQREQFPSNETSWSTEVLAPSVIEETPSPANEKVVHQDSLAEVDENTSSSSSFVPTPATQAEEQAHPPISPENERSFPNRKEQISEMKTIRSSSLLPIEHQIEQFDDKIDEIYSIIDHIKNNQVSSTNLNDLRRKITDLKFITSEIQLNKQDELRLEYELDELANLTNQIDEQEDYSLIELFEQNVNELRRIITDIKSVQSQPELLAAIKSSEISATLEETLRSPLPTGTEHLSSGDVDWTAEQMAEYFHRSPDGQLLSSRASSHLVPEDPVITRDVFFEGDTTLVHKRPSLASVTHLIPEDAQVNAENFYEGDIHQSLFRKEEIVPHGPPLVPESPLVSSDVFYEGDAQRSMFVQRPSLTGSERLAAVSPPAIDNLREIMSDLMLAASWSKKSVNIDTQNTDAAEDEEMIAESFITTEEQNQTSPVYEIVHEIENFPVMSTQSPMTVEDRDTISPFSTQSPIIIHRAILTRQETERWPQEESLLIDESAEQAPSTSGLEQIASGIRQHADDWTNSSNQRKEIYGEQYRPERSFSDATAEDHEQRVSTDETINSESLSKTSGYEDTSDEMILQTAEHTQVEDVKERDENDSYHIERTWSTDKIVEPSATVEDEQELRTSNQPSSGLPQSTVKRSSLDDQHRAPSSDESDDDDQGADQVIIQSPQAYLDSPKLVRHQFLSHPGDPIEHEHQPELSGQSTDGSSHDEIEETHDQERKLSSERFHLQSSQITTDKEHKGLPLQTPLDESEILAKTSPTGAHESVLSAKSSLGASEQQEEEDEYVSDRLSNEEIPSETPQLSEHEEEPEPQGDQTENIEIDETDQYPYERKSSEEALRMETPFRSDDDSEKVERTSSPRSLPSSRAESTEKLPEEHAEIAEQQPTDDGQDQRETRSKTPESPLLQTSRSLGDEQEEHTADHVQLASFHQESEEIPCQQGSTQKVDTQQRHLSHDEEEQVATDDEHDEDDFHTRTTEHTEIDQTDEQLLQSKFSAESPLVEIHRSFGDQKELASPQQEFQEDDKASDRLSTGNVIDQSPHLSENEDERVPSDDEHDLRAKTPEHTEIDETHEQRRQSKLSAESPVLETPPIHDDHAEPASARQMWHEEDNYVSDRLSTGRASSQSPQLNEDDERDFRTKTTDYIEINDVREQPLATKSAAESPLVETPPHYGDLGSPQQEADQDVHNMFDRLSSGNVSGHSAQLSDNEQDLVSSNDEREPQPKTPEPTKLDQTNDYPLQSQLIAESPVVETIRTFNEPKQQLHDEDDNISDRLSIGKVASQSPQPSESDEEQAPSDRDQGKRESRPKTPEPTKLDENDQYTLGNQLSAESPLVETPPHFDDQEEGNVSDRFSTGKVSSRSAQMSENEEVLLPSGDEREPQPKTPEPTKLDQTNDYPLQSQLIAESPVVETIRTFNEPKQQLHDEDDNISDRLSTGKVASQSPQQSESDEEQAPSDRDQEERESRSENARTHETRWNWRLSAGKQTNCRIAFGWNATSLRWSRRGQRVWSIQHWKSFWPLCSTEWERGRPSVKWRRTRCSTENARTHETRSNWRLSAGKQANCKVASGWNASSLRWSRRGRRVW